MSAGYANRLSDYPHKGKCGLPESEETPRALNVKLQKLTNLIQESKHTVILTGAGISTSSGIPDFRGPKGIWTLEKEQKKKKKANSKKRKLPSNNDKENDVQTKTTLDATPSIDFALAKPTYTHKAITYLVKHSTAKVNHVITQNVDGLHQKSGLSRNQLSVLHGCVFTEVCVACHTEHFRDFDVGGMSFQKTGRKCDKCSHDLVDTLLDWEDPLPEADFQRATKECEKADLVICLGTSLRIEPAGNLPTLAKRFVIVNLQATPYDRQAAIVLRAKVDHVMQSLLSLLGQDDWDDTDKYPIPTIERHWKRPILAEKNAN